MRPFTRHEIICEWFWLGEIFTATVPFSRLCFMVVCRISDDCHKITVFHVVRRRSEHAHIHGILPIYVDLRTRSTYYICYLKINETIIKRILK